jgi:hypothetical protein
MAEKNKSKSLITIPRLTGKYKEVRVTFFGASFLAPGDEGQPRYADDQFGPFIMDEVFKRQTILSRVKGVLSKSHRCRKCDADLSGLRARRRKFSLNISYKHLPPFKMEIEMPAIPCRSCGANNAINESATEYVICGAIAKAFASLKAKI